MTNAELRELATAGVRERIATMQAELAVYYEEWPELFLTAPARLLKAGTPDSNGNGNGHRPAAPPIVAPAAGRASSWTPERRAKHARVIRRALRRARKTARSTRRPMTAATKRKLSLAMKRRHASGELARARAKAAKARAAANG